jgi:hypothetical protein
MTRIRVIYAGLGVAWVCVGLSWVAAALLFLDGNSNASNSVANAADNTFAVAFGTAVLASLEGFIMNTRLQIYAAAFGIGGVAFGLGIQLALSAVSGEGWWKVGIGALSVLALAFVLSRAVRQSFPK